MHFKNRIVFFYWGFSFLFMLFVVAMSYVFWRDGPPPGHSAPFMLSVLALFWTAGTGLCTYAASQPAVYIMVLPDGSLSITWRYPFNAIRKQYPRAIVPCAQLVQAKDDEGDLYFHSRLLLPDGESIDIAEGHAKERCEKECARFNAALKKSDRI